MTEKTLIGDSTIQGQGVFAATDLLKGELILAIDDGRIVNEAHPLREGRGEFGRHCDYLANSSVVLMQPPERYINHSCDPNAFVRTILALSYVFALRTIAAGEEITYYYCINSRSDTIWQCNCGSARCRQVIHSDFLHLPHTLQVEHLPLLDMWFIEENKVMVIQLLKI